MSTITTEVALERNRRLQMVLPSSRDVPWKPLQKALSEWERVIRDRRANQALLRSLEADLPKAAAADQDAYKKALKAGHDADPGTPKEDELRQKIRAAARRLDAIDSLLEDAEADVIAVVETHAQEWLSQASDQIAGHRRQMAEALDRLEQERQAVLTAQSLQNWLRSFPDRRQKHVLRSLRGFDLPIQGVIGRNNEPTPFAQIISALRAEAKKET